jgi:hypothetical protein
VLLRTVNYWKKGNLKGNSYADLYLGYSLTNRQWKTINCAMYMWRHTYKYPYTLLRVNGTFAKPRLFLQIMFMSIQGWQICEFAISCTTPSTRMEVASWTYIFFFSWLWSSLFLTSIAYTHFQNVSLQPDILNYSFSFIASKKLQLTKLLNNTHIMLILNHKLYSW